MDRVAEILGYSKRHCNRLIFNSANRANEFDKKIQNPSPSESFKPDYTNIVYEFTEESVVSEEEIFYSQSRFLFDDEEYNQLIDSDSDDEDIEFNDIQIDLRDWAIINSITVSATRSLLLILRKYGLNVPLSRNSLFKCKKKELKTTQIGTGEYLHIGIEKNIKTFNYNFLGEDDVIEIDINVDGVPLFKSSRTCLWPILGAFVNQPYIDPFLIGVFCGKGHPESVDIYLKQYIEEANALQCNGIKVTHKQILKPFSIRAYTTDVPAKSYITGTKGHNAFSGCHKCEQKGSRLDNRTAFSLTTGNKRTDESFLNRTDKDHHSKKNVNELNILEIYNTNMVSQTPIDYMHLVHLGNAKKICTLIFDKNVFKIKNKSTEMSTDYTNFSSFMPLEFVRKTRTFQDVPRWKATEFGFLLSYGGIVLFKEYFTDKQYYHFLLLSCAIRMLSEPEFCKENAPVAQQLLEEFLMLYPEVYGRQYVSYNVHNLLHLAQDVLMYGALPSFSGYKFENFLQKIKNCIKSPTNILAQINNRYFEFTQAKSNQNNGSQNDIFNHKECTKFQKYSFKINQKDNFCYLNNEVLFTIYAFCEYNNVNSVIGRRFINYEDFFEHPIKSSDLNIFLVSKESVNYEVFPVDEIKFKFVHLPYYDSFVLIPLLH